MSVVDTEFATQFNPFVGSIESQLSTVNGERYIYNILLTNAVLTLSPPIPLTLYTLPYWSNPPFVISDIRALWRSVLSARVPECQKLKMAG